MALLVLGTAAAVTAIVGELGSGAVWGSPLSDLVWALDAAILLQTIVALPIAVVLGTPGCEIGVWGDIAARLRGEPASPPICIIGLHHLKIVPVPAATRGFDDLRRGASREPLGRGIRAPVAGLPDVIRSPDALGRPEDEERLPRLRRLAELERERALEL